MDTATHEIQLPKTDPGDRRRLLELAAAVRAHEAIVRGRFGSARPHDAALYRRLRQIGAE